MVDLSFTTQISEITIKAKTLTFTSNSFMQTSSPTTFLNISFKVLLNLYLIVPLCIILQLTDSWFFNHTLQQNLPDKPTHFLLFQVLFGTPHIIASSLLLVTNKIYFNHFKRPIIGMTLVIAFVFGIGSLFIPYHVFYIAVAGWTVYHVLKQQHGVARSVCNLPNWAFYLLLWLSILAGWFIYLGIFLKNNLTDEHAEFLKIGSRYMCIALFLSALSCQRYINNVLGKWFFWANVFLVLSSFYLYQTQYYFLAILAPRLVHDATAYIFYVTHDYNKHHAHPQNTLYRFTEKYHISIFWVLPVISFFLTFVLQSYGDFLIEYVTQFLFGTPVKKVITLGFLGYLALMHYYMEALTWKKNSPYRQFIGFSF